MLNKEMKIIEEFLDEIKDILWFVYLAIFKVAGVIPEELNWHQK